MWKMDSDKKSIPVVGFLTCNDCDVLRTKTGVYRRVKHRTLILPSLGMMSTRLACRLLKGKINKKVPLRPIHKDILKRSPRIWVVAPGKMPPAFRPFFI